MAAFTVSPCDATDVLPPNSSSVTLFNIACFVTPPLLFTCDGRDRLTCSPFFTMTLSAMTPN